MVVFSQTFVKTRKEKRIGNKIRNATKCGRHTRLHKWCMFTGSDIDFWDKTDDALHNNDALFTATPIKENVFLDGVIERDQKESDIPVCLNDIEFVDDNHVIEQWEYRTLRNQNWLTSSATRAKIARIYAREAVQAQERFEQVKLKLQVCLCIILLLLGLYIVVFLCSFSF